VCGAHQIRELALQKLGGFRTEKRLGSGIDVVETTGVETERQVRIADAIDRRPHAFARVRCLAPPPAAPALRLGRLHDPTDAGAEARFERAQRTGELRGRSALTGCVNRVGDRALEPGWGVSAQAVQRSARARQVDAGETAEAPEAAYDLGARGRGGLGVAKPPIHLRPNGMTIPVQVKRGDP
jgi:hypothetical protein